MAASTTGEAEGAVAMFGRDIEILKRDISSKREERKTVKGGSQPTSMCRGVQCWGKLTHISDCNLLVSRSRQGERVGEQPEA